MRKLILAGFAVLAMTGAATADEPLQTLILNGRCTAESKAADGFVTDDLTKRSSPYYCDSAIVETFGPSIGHPTHMMISFSDTHSPRSLLSFGGAMLDESNKMEVDHIFLKPGTLTDVTQGDCEVTFTPGKKVTGMVCAANIISGHYHTIRIVDFDAN